MTTILAEPTAHEITSMLAELAADRQLEPGGQLLTVALRGALRLTCPDLPLGDVHDEAERLIEQARREQQAAEYSETAVSRG